MSSSSTPSSVVASALTRIASSASVNSAQLRPVSPTVAGTANVAGSAVEMGSWLRMVATDIICSSFAS